MIRIIMTEGHTFHPPIPEYRLGLANDLSKTLIGLGTDIETEPPIWNALSISHDLCLAGVSTSRVS